jgi:hypothetical protein
MRRWSLSGHPAPIDEKRRSEIKTKEQFTMSLHTTIAKKAAAGLAAAGIAIGIMGASAGAASAATPTTFAHSHHVTVAVQYQVHQNELFNKADNLSVRYADPFLYKGDSNTESYSKVWRQSDKAGDTWGENQMFMTETDSSGTLHVRDVQAVIFSNGTFGWYGKTTSQLSVDIAPGATLQYFHETDDSGGDYVWSMVTITNNVY